ncbi:MAG: 4Fe-4S dicluster domain-containing protein [Thermodesulfobacteriota bacterium]|nr:4Fe-4S dicluster domain-containing protein [Thermodesulfobacteriota bacterium]
MKRIGRREFIKITGRSLTLLLLGKSTMLPIPPPDAKASILGKDKKEIADGLDTVADSRNQFAMVKDVGACIGCRRCMWGCKKENNTPDVVSPPWIEVFELPIGTSVTTHPPLRDLRKGATTSYTESPKEGKWYLPVQCNHCDNPPCVKVCPTGATYKDKDGLVLMNYDKCIGCRICIVACPYSARRFNWLEFKLPSEEVNPLVPVRYLGVVEKCTFCVHRVREGKLPRCVEVCPVRARHFGNLKDPKGEIPKLLKANMSFRLLEDTNTYPNIWYITRGKKWVKE